jgi:hypothetical protein
LTTLILIIEIHHEGKTAYGVNKNEKDSVDLTIYPKDLAKNDTPCINDIS